MQLDRLELLGRAAGDRPSLDGRHVLVGMEAEADQVAEAADPAAAPGGADGVRGVLDDAQLVALRDFVEAIHIDRQSREMHWHDGPRARSDGRLDLVEVNIARIQSHIHEDRPRPVRVMTLAVATKLKAGVMTSSPAPIPQARSAISIPAVAEVCVRIGRPPRYRDNAASNSATFGPVASHPDRNTSTTHWMVSSSIVGRVNGSIFFTTRPLTSGRRARHRQ